MYRPILASTTSSILRTSLSRTSSLIRPSLPHSIITQRSIHTPASNIPTTSSYNTNHLYNLSLPLQHSRDFLPCTQLAITKINTLRQYLRQNQSKLTSSQQLLLLDNISNELCNIMDVAEVCRHSHSSSQFQQAAEASFALLSEFIIELNADKFLYQEVLKPLIQRHEEGTRSSSTTTLTEEELYFAYDMQFDFQNEGIHLTEEAQQVMKSLQQLVVQYETLWSQNIANGVELKQTMDIGPYPKELHNHFLSLSKWCSNFTTQKRREDRYVSIPIDRRIMSPLIKSIGSPILRKSLWYESFVQPVSNISTLHKMLHSRQALANSLDMSSFTHKAIAKHVNPQPEQIDEILLHLHQATMQKAKEETDILLHYQRHDEGNKSTLTSLKEAFSSTPPTPQGMMPWDLGYYMQQASMYMQQQHEEESSQKANSSSSEYANESITSFLPLQACVDGLRYLSQSLYNLIMEEVPLEKYESWTQNNAEIRKFFIFDATTREFIGTCYFDLYQRDGKFPGAAHFTVRCQCDRVVWNDEIKDGKQSQGLFPMEKKNHSDSSNIVLETTKQTPIVSLVFHFQRPSSSNRTFTNRLGQLFSSGQATSEPLLSLHDLETLFHEWGHALHSLLSKTKFQHLSGTRGSTDYIEIPSHLMEYFARSPEVISKFAKHYITGDPVPKELLQKALQKKEHFAITELQHQLFLSAADQYIFGEKTKKFVLSQDLNSSGEETYLHLLEGINQIQTKFTSLPLVPTFLLQDVAQDYDSQTKTHRLKRQICQQLSHIPYVSLLNHGHFVNYGGSYYSYLFAKMYAAQIWSKLFQQDPFNKNAGEYLRQEMLSAGCSRNHKEVLNLVGKGSLDPTFYLQQILR